MNTSSATPTMKQYCWLNIASLASAATRAPSFRQPAGAIIVYIDQLSLSAFTDDGSLRHRLFISLPLVITMNIAD